MLPWQYIVAQIPPVFEFIARGGGGGSGGGGGGGGGGSHGGSGSKSNNPFVTAIMVCLFGGLPVGFALGNWLRTKNAKTERWTMTQTIVWSIMGAAAILAIAGSIISGSALVATWLIMAAICTAVGVAAGLYGWLNTIRQPKRVTDGLSAAAQTDSAWTESAIIDFASQAFLRYQYDWSTLNYASVASYTTPRYYSHSTLMLKALEWMKRRNDMSDVKILEAKIVDMHDDADNRNDRVTIAFTTTATDKTIDARNDAVLFVDNSMFTEYWEFLRDGNSWRLDHVRQATENLNKASIDLQTFAAVNNMYYSADWGWLLLPADGELFRGGKFGTSDINNHVIGLMNDMIVQIYTYTKNPSNDNPDDYLVAQTSIPKSYGRILVRRRGLINLKPRGMDKISMEWSQFNDKYDVFASTGEGATSFELLHPVFMEKLEALPFKVSMEVVDNVVYLYAKTKTNPDYYAMMLTLLQNAHKEMRL